MITGIEFDIAGRPCRLFLGPAIPAPKPHQRERTARPLPEVSSSQIEMFNATALLDKQPDA